MREMNEMSDTHQTAALRALAAEDNDINAEIIQIMLGKLGFEVDRVSDGKQAVDYVGAHEYDIVLMDLQMPVMDGLEACRAIRDREKATGKRVHIVALTAFATASDRQRAVLAGMDAYIPKPLTFAKLQEFIAQWKAVQKAA